MKHSRRLAVSPQKTSIMAHNPAGSKQRRTETINRKRILYVANVAWFFRSHRLPLALEAIRRGYDVHLASAFQDQQERSQFERLHIITHEVPFQRSGSALVSEAATILRLKQLYSLLQPSICHNISIKPVIYGGILGRVYGIPTVNAISGLGYSYIAEGFKARIRRTALNLAYSGAVKGRNSRVIVQNDDDWSFFRNKLGVDEEQLILIKGSGVDLKQFDPSRPVSTPPLIVLPARMLMDKGVREFVAAARALKMKGFAGRFVLVGGLDPENRAGLTQNEIDQLTNDGVVEHWGHRSDIPDILSASQIVCLPSYREGFPKALLEAAAAGRPIIATDVPGCREIVKHGENGLLVPPRDSSALCSAIEQLLMSPGLCKTMGQRGRALVEKYFSLDIVVTRTMRLYQDILQ